MNVKEKLDGFSKVAIREAEKKRKDMLDEINKEYKKICDDITSKARKKSDSLVMEEGYKAEQTKNKDILNATMQSKRELIEIRNRLKDSLFKEVLDELNAYVKKDEYMEFMISEIKDLSGQFNSEIKVYLCKKDMALQDNLKELKNLSFAESKADLIGGYIASIEEKNILIDNSYKQKLDEVRDDFVGFKII